jgi:hypothetical protein
MTDVVIVRLGVSIVNFQIAQSTSGQFHYRHATFSSLFKSKVDNILANVADLRI